MRNICAEVCRANERFNLEQHTAARDERKSRAQKPRPDDPAASASPREAPARAREYNLYREKYT